jgi:hypothetical protein
MKFLTQLFKSKTIIANVVMVAAGIVGYLAGHDVIAQNPELVAALVTVSGVLNVVLRLLTSTPVSAK